MIAQRMTRIGLRTANGAVLTLTLLAGASLVDGCGGRTLPDAEQAPVPIPTPIPIPIPTPKPVTGPIPPGTAGECGTYAGSAAATIRAFASVRAAGVYMVSELQEECSGAGGAHYTLNKIGGCAAPIVVHFGEHACYFKLRAGSRVMVAVDPTPFSIENRGWCLTPRTYDGVARAITELPDSTDTAAAVAALGCEP
jgi:hypothetical protein